MRQKAMGNGKIRSAGDKQISPTIYIYPAKHCASKVNWT
jgi:hypothetical protein